MGRHIFFFKEADPLTGYFSQFYPFAFTAPVPAACVKSVIEIIKAKSKSDSSQPTTSSTAPESSTTSTEPKEITFRCAEQWMMLHKALLSNDQDSAKAIMSASTPRKMKALGRAVEGFDENLWNKYKFQIVCEGNYWKFTQKDETGDAEEIRQALLGTGDKNLVEASPFDKIWGIGLKEEDAKNTPEEKWKGSNLLGKALVKVRTRIRLEAEGKEVPEDWNVL